jgi:hypothetical protein
MHDDRNDIISAFSSLTELQFDVEDYSLQWVAISEEGVVAADPDPETLLATLGEELGMRVDDVLFHYVNRVVEA